MARALACDAGSYGRGAWAGIAVVVLLAACGSNGGGSTAKHNHVALKSPAQIFAAAHAALRSVRAFVVSGTILQGRSTVHIKLIYEGPSKLQLHGDQAGKVLDLILLPGAGYFRSNRPPASLARFANRWREISASAARRDFADVISNATPQSLAAQLGQSPGTLTRAGTTTIDGTPGVVLRTASAGNTSRNTIVVATVGPPYPLRITGTCVSKRGCVDPLLGDMTLSDFNHAPAVTAPSHPHVGT